MSADAMNMAAELYAEIIWIITDQCIASLRSVDEWRLAGISWLLI